MLKLTHLCIMSRYIHRFQIYEQIPYFTSVL